MRVTAAVLALVFSALHGAGVPALLGAAPAPTGSDQPGAIPPPARVAWAAAAAVGFVAALALLVTRGPLPVMLVVASTTTTAGLAVANGYWIKGTPTPRHHAVRLVAATAVIATALLSL